jgi:hypothetical protein
MAPGMIQKLIIVFQEICESLSLPFSSGDIERISGLVHRTMSLHSRQFHTLDHVFGFIECKDPLISLAAIFHDMIYYHVDNGILPEVEALLVPTIVLEDEAISIRPDIPWDDEACQVCLKVFGYLGGQRLSQPSGLNEFLSALVMARLLYPAISKKDLVAVTVCIEASIPFRGPTAEGLDVPQVMEKRLRSSFPELTEEEIGQMIRRSVLFSNKDVEDFAMEDPARFLNNTWKLLPELNAALRQRDSYSIKDYRVAMGKMLAYFRSLKPAIIYRVWRDYPSEADYARLLQGAARNLTVAHEYLEAKLLSASLLEAIAYVSGGDAPIALFMGDIPHKGESPERLEQFLPAAPRPKWVDPNNPVYRLLRDGRLDDASFDLKHSPLALFIFHRLAPGALTPLMRQADLFFKGSLAPEDYLRSWEPSLRADVMRAVGAMVSTRKEPIESWITSNAR